MLEQSTVVIIRRGIGRGLLTLWRERQWMTALGALFGVFVLVQLLLLVLTGLQGVQTVLRHRTDLRLEIRQEASDQDVQIFLAELHNLHYVSDTVYITKEKAFEQTRATDPELIAFLEEFRIQNPFADSIGITLNDLDAYETFAAFIEDKRWHRIIDPEFLSTITDQERQVYALLGVTNAIRSLTVVILLVTAMALVFIITELVRRRAMARSDEVLVQRLVGATPLSITVPFITEAIVLLFVAIILSTAVVLCMASLLPLYIPALSHTGILSAVHREITPLMRTLLPLLLCIEIAAMPIIASIGAWLGVRPQVHSPRMSYAV